jgi:hypothetical protein
VPQNQAPGLLTLQATFNAGPLGIVDAARPVEIVNSP